LIVLLQKQEMTFKTFSANAKGSQQEKLQKTKPDKQKKSYHF